MAVDDILVTSYNNPDLDGSACSLAYAEYLNKKGESATAALFGTPFCETQFVWREFAIPELPAGEKIVEDFEKIALVDASNLPDVAGKIDPAQVIEIIDHRVEHEADKFPNAKAQIELVGAAATLIAEKYKEGGIEISCTSAAALYAAIVSNTINFKAKVTTDRDHQAAEWLQEIAKPAEDFIYRMFADKSQKQTSNLAGTLRSEKYFSDINDKRISIYQLEIIDVDKFVVAQREEIKELLDKIKIKDELDYIILTCIDLEKGRNKIVAFDDDSKTLVEKSLGVKFGNNIAEHDLIMRKEMIPKVKKGILTNTKD